MKNEIINKKKAKFMAISNGITMIYYIADATLRTTKKPDMPNYTW